jgi:hypothetical protein
MGLQSVSQPIGRIINLRRNTNNVPGDAVAGTIQSASQPIGDIIRLRRNYSNTPSSGWFIDGVEWTGLIKEIGAGKEYSTITAAVLDSQPYACLFLIYPGTYSGFYDNRFLGVNNSGYIRGMGATPNDVFLDGVDITTYYDMVIENISLNIMPSAVGPAVNLAPQSGTIDITVKINNCIIQALDFVIQTRYCHHLTLIVEHTQLIKNSIYYDLAGWNDGDKLDRSRVSLDKVSYTDTWRDRNCEGVFAQDDKAVNGTSGYGADNINKRILQQPVAPDLSTTSQLIGQSGIRLRRNSSNVPGD